MGSLAGDRPKALLEIAGEPLLARILGQLGPPVVRAVVVVPPGDDRIPGALGPACHGVRITYCVQPEPRGVGHAVVQARGEVRGPFLVVMADTFYRTSLHDFLETWSAGGDDGAVLVEPPPPRHELQGRVTVTDGRVTALRKGRGGQGSTHRLAGAVVLPPDGFGFLERAAPADTGEVELETAVSDLIEAGRSFAAVSYDSWRMNVNTPEHVAEVVRRLRAEGHPGPGHSESVVSAAAPQQEQG